MTGAARRLVVAVAAVLATAGAGAAPAPPPPAHRGLRPGTVYVAVVRISLKGHLVIRAGARVRRRPIDVESTIKRRAKVLAVAHHVVTRLQVTYLQADTPGRGQLVPPELRGRTFVITRGGAGSPLPKVTEYGADVDTDIARRIVADNLDVLAPDPMLRIYRHVFTSPGKAVALPTKLLDRWFAPDNGMRIVSSTAKLVKVDGGIAYIHIADRFVMDLGHVRVTGHGTGEATYDVATGEELSVHFEMPIRGHGAMRRRGVRIRDWSKAMEHMSVVYTYPAAPAHHA